MARWLPATLAAIAEADRTAYFRDLDERVAARIEALERFAMPPSTLQTSDPMGYLGAGVCGRRSNLSAMRSPKR